MLFQRKIAKAKRFEKDNSNKNVEKSSKCYVGKVCLLFFFAFLVMFAAIITFGTTILPNQEKDHEHQTEQEHGQEQHQ